MKIFTLIEIAFFLKKNILFQDLDLDILLAIAEKMGQDTYAMQEMVFEKEQIASKMYFIAKGGVQLINEEHLIAELKKEDFFGDEALFNEKHRAYSAICIEETLLLSLSKNHLLSIISECPSVGITLLKLFAKKIQCRYE